MTEEEAFRELDLPLGSTPESIDALFRKKAKRCHPDGGDPAQILAFERLLAARQMLRDRPPAQIGVPVTSPIPAQPGTCGPDRGDEGRRAENAQRLVREVMAMHDLIILYDHSIEISNDPKRGYGPEEERAWLNRSDDWNLERLFDAVMDEVRSAEHDLSAADIKRSLRRVVREDQRGRENTVMRPLLYDRPDAAEQARAEAAWLHLTSTTLHIDPALAKAVLQHFIWQVKRKQLRRPVSQHLMAVIVGPEQGSGKTTFLRLFLAPLKELASPPVLLSDLADSRSGDILRFPVVVVDDVERADSRQVPVLKSLLTADAVSRRRLGSSFAEKRRQRCTPIGTANEPIGRLIADPTGHRRFIDLRFRNGAVAKGGDSAVWRAVNETDYKLLWRSVDGFGPSPILPHLTALAEVQAITAPVDPLRECLISLDLRSEAVLNISVRGGVRADELRELLCAHMGVEISNTAFSARMSVLVGDPKVPLNPKVRISKGWVYPLKYPRGPVEMSTVPDGPSRRDPDRFRAFSQTVAP